MKYNVPKNRMYVVLSMAVALVLSCHADTCTDEELRHDVLEFLTVRCCGRVEASRVLTSEVRFDGDTNRLACVLAEFAQTNDIQVAELAMWQLKKYCTAAQLPFLYSCATNPALGNIAIESVLRIEGVTSNSVAALQGYLSFTNAVTRQQAYDRAITSREFLDVLKNSDAPIELKSAGLQVVRSFAADINTSNSIVDKALITVDDTYRYSKRRIAVMRAAYPRCFNEYQTNYVSNAIYELSAYPEANLPE